MLDFLNGPNEPTFPRWIPPDTKWTVSELFSNASIVLHRWANDNVKDNNIPGKVAQLRFYPRLLSPAEVLDLQNTAEWPSDGVRGPQNMKQCIEAATDYNYFDTNDVDGHGHSCLWYAQVEQQEPYICRKGWAKLMCPVTCNGRCVGDGLPLRVWCVGLDQSTHMQCLTGTRIHRRRTRATHLTRTRTRITARAHTH